MMTRTLFMNVLLFLVVVVVCAGSDVKEEEFVRQSGLPSHSIDLTNTIQFTAENQSDPLLHSVFQDYCHLSSAPYAGNEGSPIKGHHLRRVWILLSTGQRSQKILFENITSPTVNCNFEHHARSSNHEKIRTFPEVADIYKHMQPLKSAFKIFQPYPNSQVCEQDELSPFRVMQHILLGEQLGRRYSKLKLQEPTRNENVVLAHSVQKEALYQSLFSFLHGLLHEKSFVRVVLRKYPYDFCIHSKSTKCSCPKADYLRDKVAKGIQNGFHIFKDSPNLDQNIYRKLKVPVYTEMSSRDLITFLSSWFCEARDIPCYQGNCLNVSVSNLEEIFKSAFTHLNQIVSSNFFSNYAKLQTYHFFQRFLKWLEEYDGSKVSTFMAEEEFMLMVMSVLGYQPNTLLPQASRLVFELHSSERDLFKDQILKIYLNGIDISEKLSVRPSLSGAFLDSVNVIDYYQNVVLKSFKNNNYFDECLS